MTEKEIHDLIEQAIIARKRAYAPYSHFPVGAAVLTNTGEVYTGCNIENASYGATCCAERVALFKAISEGHEDIRGIAVVAASHEAVPPCGICRQVMIELAPQAVLAMANLEGKRVVTTVKELLPGAFGGSFL
ncbi:MAG: cytidine deaminase [Firmicutes bacterium]|mgnify:CR=1 FL=1|nr:cytidine deaminase [Bacillota bacterium]